ncbi:MAG: hypothetical protein ACT4R6_10290 [Gemmatimonadaceae bacterium]
MFTSSSAQSRATWLLVLGLIPFGVLAAYHWTWGAPIGAGDHSQYLAHALAVAEGRPYADVGYIPHAYAPMVAPRAYPPGLPLTLAPIVALGGVESPLIRVLMLLSAVAFGYFAYRRLALSVAAWQAALAAAISVFAVEALNGTLVPISDVGTAALLWAIILAADTAKGWTARRCALVTALGFAAMAYRVPAAVIVPALAVHAVLTWKQHNGRALLPAAIWSAVGGALLALGIFRLPYWRYLVPDLADIGGRIANVLRIYSVGLFEAELYPFAANSLNDAYHAIATVAVIAGAGVLLWRSRRSMLAAVSILYLVLLFMSPAIDSRYLWPLFPVFAAGLVVGLHGAVRLAFMPFSRRQAGPAAVTTGAALLILFAALRQQLQIPERPSLDRNPDAAAMFAWLRAQREREPMRVMFHNPRVLTLATRVPAMPALVLSPAATMRAIREREITHTVWQIAELRECRARLANALPSEFPDRFALDYENRTFRVYRVLEGYEPTDTTDYTPEERRRALCRRVGA